MNIIDREEEEDSEEVSVKSRITDYTAPVLMENLTQFFKKRISLKLKNKVLGLQG